MKYRTWRCPGRSWLSAAVLARYGSSSAFHLSLISSASSGEQMATAVEFLDSTLDRLEEETVAWSRELLAKSPLALRMLKGALNAVTDGAAGMQQFAGDATLLYYMSEEAQEGRDAFKDKRAPDFAKFPRRP